MERNNGFEAILNEIDDIIMTRTLEHGKSWDLVPIKLQLIALRIESQKLLAMQEQNMHLKAIAGHLSDISGSAQSMEPVVNRKM